MLYLFLETSSENDSSVEKQLADAGATGPSSQCQGYQLLSNIYFNSLQETGLEINDQSSSVKTISNETPKCLKRRKSDKEKKIERNKKEGEMRKRKKMEKEANEKLESLLEQDNKELRRNVEYMKKSISAELQKLLAKSVFKEIFQKRQLLVPCNDR